MILVVLRRLTEKFRTRNKKMFLFIFVDLEKAFD